MSLHHSLSGYDIHVSFAWTYANASARTGASGFVAEDVGKFALQSDTNALYMLTATTPTWQLVAAGGGAGTVTSVALSLPAEFSVSGSPITGSGTISVSKANESANQVYAGPSSGPSAAPGFRTLVAADLPSVPLSGLASIAADTLLGNNTGSSAAPSALTNPIVSGEMQASDFKASGLTGATAASRYVGATASGAPASGTFVLGDWVIDQSGKIWICTAGGTPGTWQVLGNDIRGVDFGFDGGGTVITVNSKWTIVVEYPCTILSATLLADQSGSAVVDVLRSNYAGFPGSLASLCGASKPTLASAQAYEDTTLSGWTTTLNAGDILRAVVNSITTCQQLFLSLKVQRTG